MTGSEVGESGGRDQERSTSWDSNSGRPKCNDAVCQRAAHKPIGTNGFTILNMLRWFWDCFFTQFYNFKIKYLRIKYR